MDAKLLTRLQEVSILDLRIVGRAVGVVRPTKLTRKELVQAILEINEGLLSPAEASKRGQPVKHVEMTPTMADLVESIKISAHSNRVENPQEKSNAPYFADSGYVHRDAPVQDGYYFTGDNGQAYAYNNEFELLAELGIARSIEDGAMIRFGAEGSPKTRRIYAIDGIAPEQYVLSEAYNEQLMPGGKKLDYFGLPIREGGVTLIRGANARLVTTAIGEALQPDSVWAIDFSGQVPYEWDVTSESVHVDAVRSPKAEQIRFIAGRAKRSAALGERVLLVASGAGDDSLPLWRDACVALFNGGSVTLLMISDREQNADTVIETEGMEQCFPPIDYVRSDSAYYGGRDESLTQIKAKIAGMSAKEAWQALRKE